MATCNDAIDFSVCFHCCVTVAVYRTFYTVTTTAADAAGACLRSFCYFTIAKAHDAFYGKKTFNSFRKQKQHHDFCAEFFFASFV